MLKWQIFFVMLLNLKNTSDGNMSTVLYNKVLLSLQFFFDISIETIDLTSLLYTIQWREVPPPPPPPISVKKGILLDAPFLSHM